MADTCVYVRFAGKAPLHPAALTAGLSIGESALVVVQDAEGTRRVASVAGRCERHAGLDAPVFNVVASYNINPASPLKLAKVASIDQPSDSPKRGHRWGGLGLTAGGETHISAAHEPMKPDAWYAMHSEGYREIIANRLHQLVPGDRCRLRGEDVMVTAINRRENAIELVDAKDQSVRSMPLDEFIESEERA